MYILGAWEQNFSQVTAIYIQKNAQCSLQVMAIKDTFSEIEKVGEQEIFIMYLHHNGEPMSYKTILWYCSY